jgi:hypothetical protein
MFMQLIKKQFIQISAHPLTFGLLGLILGIYIATSKPSFFSINLLCINIICICVLILITRTEKKISLVLICISFLIGYFRTSMQLNTWQSFYSNWENKKIEIIGSIVDCQLTEHKYMKACITLHIKSIREKNTKIWYPINQSIYIYTKNFPFLVDDSIILSNLIFKPIQNQSFCTYLIKEGISATCFCHNLRYLITHRPKFSLHRFIHHQKNRIINAIQKKASQETATLYCTLFLGNRSINKEYVNQNAELFKRWGISHFLARSGLHLVIFITLWQAILRFLPIPFLCKEFLLIFHGHQYHFFEHFSHFYFIKFAHYAISNITIFTSSA